MLRHQLLLGFKAAKLSIDFKFCIVNYQSFASNLMFGKCGGHGLAGLVMNEQQ